VVLRARLVVGGDGRRDGARVLGGVGLHGMGSSPHGERADRQRMKRSRGVEMRSESCGPVR
jgi:hypothetical protein